MTREEAIDILYGMKADNLNLDDLYTKDKYDALEMAIKALEQTKWIPVSERLPEKSGRYLAYIINEYDNKLQYAMTAYFFSDSIFSNPWSVDDESASDNVVAWMPLPEPYKTESEDKG